MTEIAIGTSANTITHCQRLSPLQSRGNQKQSSGKIQLKDHIEDLGSKELAERGKEDPRSAKSLFPLTTGMARGET